MKAILVTTSLRGVFAGLVDNDQDLTQRTLRLVDAKMAIYWGTTGGVAGEGYVNGDGDNYGDGYGYGDGGLGQ